jgi:NADH dehydrogenase
MAGMSRIVIVGGGYGGIECAKKLCAKLRNGKDASITLIDRNPFHTLMTELHEVAGWRVDPESVMVSFQKIFASEKIDIVTDTVSTVDFQAKTVAAGRATYPYDYLVLGSGAEPEFFGIPGIKENSFSLWSLDDALKLRGHMAATFLAASREGDQEKRRELLTFVIAGAGFTGIELAGEFLEYRDAMCDYYHLDRAEVRIAVVEALPSILVMLDEKMRAKAEKYLKAKNVELMLNSPIVKAEPGIVSIKDGRTLKTSTFVWTCGVMGSAFAGNLDLTKGRCTNPECPHSRAGSCKKRICEFKTSRGGLFVEGKRGRILVNENMESVDYPGVYLAGDTLWFLEGGKPLPQIVETALQTADCAAHNILADIRGGGQKKTYRSKLHGFMISVGSRYAVANVSGMKLTGFPAMALKHLVNLHYLWGIAGFNACFDYLRHEIFRRDDDRSFWPGRLVGQRVQGLWVALLRMFVGMMWFIEGVSKASWLDPKNSGWVNAFLFGIKPVSAEGAEALSAASEEGGAAAAALDPAAALESAKAAATAAGGIFRPPLIHKPTGLYKWVLKLLIGDGTQPYQLVFAYLMRSAIVLGEIGVGLALFGGALTFLASGVSLILCLLFILSGMATQEIFWYLFAGVTLLGASGKTAGLDSWIIPWIDRLWRGSRLGQRSKLYSGEPVTRKPKKG